MAYLFDTDIISAVLRPRPDVRVIRRLAGIPPEDQFTSAITVGELVFGAERKGRHDLLQHIDALLDAVEILAFDGRAARIFGELKTRLEREGTSLAEPDLRIAAIALSKNLTLVTGNTRHFDRVPKLIVENWLV